MKKLHIGPTLPVRRADIVVLTVILAVFAVGLLTSAGKPSRAMWIGFMLFLQAMFVVWVTSMPENRPRNDALRVSNQIQLILFIRIFATMGVALGYMLAMLYLANSLYSSPRVLAMQAQVKATTLFYFAMAPVLLTVFSVWYVLQLRSRGLALAAMAHGAHRRLAAEIPGSLPQVTQRLEHHLHTLVSPSGAPMPWSMYGKRPTVTRTVMNDHEVRFACIWSRCPATVILSARNNGAGSTMLRVHCELRKGIHRIDLAVNPYEEVMLIGHLQANLVQLLHSEFTLSQSRKHQKGLRRHALEMQLRILQAQIEPHFFFNTLANLRQLYRTDAGAGEAMLDHLIGYLRSAMDDLRADASTVGKEFDLTAHYLAIMKVRMGERLSYTFINHDNVSEAAFPPAMLISLVENAIKHGLRESADGQLQITAARAGESIRISVLDNGPGFSSVEGTGVGLSNIRQRLEALFGERAWLEVGAPAEGGFISTIVVPAAAPPQ